MPLCATRSREPIAEKLYILEQRAIAENDCEITACEVALRVLERRHPWLKTPVTETVDLTDFPF